MPPRNKRKRPTVKTEPPNSSPNATHVWQGHAKRVKVEPDDSGEDWASDSDEVIVEVVVEMSDDERGYVVPSSRVQQPAQSVRRSAGGRPPRRGVDVASLYEETGVDQLARSLGQVVKEECGTVGVSSNVKVEVGDGSPLRVSDYVRRAAAVRAAQLLRDDEGGSRETSDTADGNSCVAVRRGQKQLGRKRSSRFKFTEEQRALLRAQFDADPYPNRAIKEDLSEQLGVEYMSVHYWFGAERERRGTVRSNYDSARKRCSFGAAVYDELVSQFELNPRPDLATRKALAAKAGASLKRISSWFSFRRNKSELGSTQKVQITPALRAELETVFQANPYPDRETRSMLAEKFGCSMTQILTWFHSQRRKAGIKRNKEDYSRWKCQFGPEGYDRLVAQFEFDPYPDVETRVALAAELGGTVVQVSEWFQKRRTSSGVSSKANIARQLCALGPSAYDELVASFEVEPFPDRKTREALATKTGGTLKQITDWFKKRRQKEGILPRSDSEARRKCAFGVKVYDELVAQFEADPFPDSTTVKTLAQKADGTPIQIRSWFRHRRKRFGIQRSGEERARQACKFGPVVYGQLVAQFEADPFPSGDVIQTLAERAGATAAQIRNWFKTRRSKHLKQNRR